MSTTTSLHDFLPRFGLSDFRPGQEDVIQSVVDGKDVLCVMPTGGGKSLCYQLPSQALDGLTIVVSPLIALMQDQVDTLKKKGFRAELINSSLSPNEQFDRMRSMAEGAYDLVYIAPERLRNSRFLDFVRQTKVALLAIDEAHCISEWGHDFRPDYARLGQFRVRQLGGIQTIALTATATPTVRDDIVRLLSLHEPKSFVTGFSRDNLHFSVQQCSSDREKDEKLTELIQTQSGSGIVYAATRKRCEELAAWLPEKLRRPVGIYHGGLEPQQRRKVQEDFMAGKLSAIVATNAFGMGIDKSDIRFVVHYNMPGSLEAYYQEAGRAGRDGLPSRCLLLFSYADRYIQEFFIDNNYPSRELVQKVYGFLQSLKEDPIELTLDQIKDIVQAQTGSESIGTAERLIAKTGVLERLDSSANQAVLRIDSELPSLVDMLPREAKVRRRVLQAAEKIVGDRRGEEVYFTLDRLIKMSDQPKDSVLRSLRELCKLNDFDYVPPFRGRALHFREHGIPFHKLEIDFEGLEKRKRAEHEKLEHVIRFAQTPNCRQLSVLNYFGDPSAAECGNCDRCDKHGHRPASKSLSTGEDFDPPDTVVNEAESELLTKVVRIVLSGLARTHGRFGKGLVAQMLSGSQNKKLQQLKLDRLSTYGLLKGLKQAQVSQLLDAVCNVGLAEQIEVTQRRPTVKLSSLGENVMKGTEPLPLSFTIPRALKVRAIACVRTSVAISDERPESSAEPKPAGDPALTTSLRHWRRDAANELGVPAYRIFSNSTLASIAATAPQTVSELEAISGVGPATIEQFGSTIVELIQSSDSGEPEPFEAESTAETSEPKPPISASAPIEPKPSPDYDGSTSQVDGEEYWSWKLLKDGYSVEDCCVIRRIDQQELLMHLLQAARNQRPVNLEWVAGNESDLIRELANNQDSDQESIDSLPKHLDPLLVEIAKASRG